jgi:DNA-binding NarL/FixJ family response regulator
METIRVLIADDQAITRSGLKALLTSLEHIEVVGEASDGEEVVRLAESLEPDVILMDLRMPVLNGIEATRRIHRAQPHIGILVVTVFEDDTSVFPAIRAGARGYLLKNTDQEELQRAIQTVANGGAIFSPGIAQRVMQYLTTPAQPAPKQAFDELTTREHSILERLTEGLSNAEIAEKLGISSKTVSNNVSNILLKLQATDRAKLMLMALEAGIGHKEH